MTDTVELGRRERKKAMTRTAISDVATRLFVERGFGAVTVADIAEAADVSIKTVFNHFGSKEELFLDRDAAMRRLVVGTVADRPAGTTPTGALGALLAANCILDEEGWGPVDDPARAAAFRGFLATWEAAPSLRARQLLGIESLADALARAVARERGAAEPDAAVRAFAAMLVAAVHLRQQTISEAVLAGVNGAEVRRRARRTAAETLGRAAVAFADLDRPAA